MKSIKPYEKYKPSGIEWLGSIPEHWEVNKLKLIAECFPSNVDKLSKEDEIKVKLCNYTDVYKNNFISNNLKFMEATASDEQIKKFALLKNDIVVTKDSETSNDIAVPALVIEDLSNVICGYHLAIVRPKFKLHSKYLFRLFLHKQFNSQFEIASNGVTRVGLGVYDLKNAVATLPPINEQIAISNFLDYKLSNIDRFIKKKKQLIKLLYEQKAGIINHAVTKGLDLNAKMKQSGIEWLGEIPEHWEVRKLKYLAKIKTGRTPKIQDSTTDFFENGEFNWYSPGDFKENGILEVSRRKVSFEAKLNNQIDIFPKNTIYLIGIGGTIGKIGISDVEASSNQQVNAIIFNNKVYPMFGFYVLKCSKNQVDLLADFTTLPIINQSKTKQIIVTVPPLDEQKLIVKFINGETIKLNLAISTIEKEITLTQEYRTALIAEAVTGKIDVRDYKIPEVLGQMEADEVEEKNNETEEIDEYFIIE